MGYTPEIDTYVYLTFTDDAGEEEYWRLGTYDEVYDTVINGGVFPWDDNEVDVDNRYIGMKGSASYFSS